jgi:uncharacterized protein
MGGPREPVTEFEATVWTRDDVALSLSIRLPGQPAPDSDPVGSAAGSGRPGYPVILDCHPYRKDDLFSFRGAGLYEYFNSRGIATARLDVRGTGRSGGTVPPSEYSDAEIDDCVEVIAWLAAQPWSNGSVGMWGISWSAINTLLVAARRPPALHACIAVHPSDELFASDIHYIDGLFHYDLYELSIDLLNGITPGPDFALDERLLADRFDQPPWLATVLSHQSRDGYWRSRSLAPGYDKIACPVFLVGGWYDGYHECVFRLLDHLLVPAQAWVGPWTHVLPHMGGPGQPADWLAHAADWWDRWLRPDPVPVTAAPHRQVSLFTRDWHGPAGDDTKVTGTWRTSTSWPIPGMTATSLRLEEGTLTPFELSSAASSASAAAGDMAAAAAQPVRELVIDSPPWIGNEVGHWWGDLAADQAPLDADCAVFDSGQLDADVTVLGAPLARLWVKPTPGCHLFARLEDVAPDGRVTLVTGAGTSVPADGDGDQLTELALHWTSWSFPAGHRIRLALSTALWPMFWPASSSGPVTIRLGGAEASSLTLPVPPPEWGAASGPAGGQALTLPPGSWGRPEPRWELDRHADPARFTWATSGSTELEFATMTSSQQLIFTVTGGPDTEATASGEATMDIDSPGRSLSWQTQSSLRSSNGQYRYQFRRLLLDGGTVVRERTWEYGIPRRRQ